MADRKLGELSAGKFLLSTLMMLGLAMLIFFPLSRNMKTVDETSDSQKKIDALEKRVSEIDVLKGRLEEISNRGLAPAEKPPQKNKGHQSKHRKRSRR